MGRGDGRRRRRRAGCRPVWVWGGRAEKGRSQRLGPISFCTRLMKHQGMQSTGPFTFYLQFIHQLTLFRRWPVGTKLSYIDGLLCMVQEWRAGPGCSRPDDRLCRKKSDFWVAFSRVYWLSQHPLWIFFIVRVSLPNVLRTYRCWPGTKTSGTTKLEKRSRGTGISYRNISIFNGVADTGTSRVKKAASALRPRK